MDYEKLEKSAKAKGIVRNVVIYTLLILWAARRRRHRKRHQSLSGNLLFPQHVSPSWSCFLFTG